MGGEDIKVIAPVFVNGKITIHKYPLMIIGKDMDFLLNTSGEWKEVQKGDLRPNDIVVWRAEQAGCGYFKNESAHSARVTAVEKGVIWCRSNNGPQPEARFLEKVSFVVLEKIFENLPTSPKFNNQLIPTYPKFYRYTGK